MGLITKCYKFLESKMGTGEEDLSLLAIPACLCLIFLLLIVVMAFDATEAKTDVPKANCEVRLIGDDLSVEKTITLDGKKTLYAAITRYSHELYDGLTDKEKRSIKIINADCILERPDFNQFGRKVSGFKFTLDLK